MSSPIYNITRVSVAEVNSLYSFFLIDVIFKELAIRNPLTLKTITLYRDEDFDSEILERIITFLSITYHSWIGVNLDQQNSPIIRNKYDLLHKPNDVVHLFLLNSSDRLPKLRLKERLLLTSNSVIIGFHEEQTHETIQRYYKQITDSEFNSTNLKRVIFVTLDTQGGTLIQMFDLVKKPKDAEQENDTDLKNIQIPKINMNGEIVTVYMVTRLPKALNVEPDPNHADQIVFAGRDGLMTSMLANYFNASLLYKITPESLNVRQEGNISQISNVEFTRDETGPM